MPAAESIRAQSQWKLRPDRTANVMTAKMRGAFTVEQDIIVRNFSSEGLGAIARDCPPGLAETVLVTLGPIREKCATVQWVRGDRFGLQFHEPLSSTDHDYLTCRSVDARPGFELFN